MKKKERLPCLALCEGEIAPRVLVCGDPARAKSIADKLAGSTCLAQNREYHTYGGSWKGTPVTVTSHGVGAGGAAIVFESLCRAGAKVIIRVGTCGGMQKGIDAGSIVIGTGCCRDDGVTEKMIPLSYPAIAHRDVVNALADAAREKNIDVHVGIVMTNALFYAGLLPSNVRLFMQAGVKAMENEAAALLVTAELHQVKAGVILAADAPAFELVGVEGYEPDQECVAKAVEDEIEIALDALVQVETG